MASNPSMIVGSEMVCPSATPVTTAASWAANQPMIECLHHLFEAQVNRTPDATAVVQGDQRLTYAELNWRANALAVRLSKLGAGPEVLVGLCAERSLEMMVGLLGILKAGGAYVPLDPDYPNDRLSFMLADSGIGLLVTQPHLVSSLPDTKARIICLDPALQSADDDEFKENAAVGGSHLAYVMFTSGSTGQPKGVMIEHRGAVNTILDVNSRFNVSFADRLLALSSFSFDLSIYDYFGMLSVGGTIVMPDHQTARYPEHWAELLIRHQVSIWNTVPASMEMMVTQEANRLNHALSSLRLVLLSGDWIPVTLPDRLRSINPTIRVVSLGGATEASCWSVIFPIAEVNPTWKSIPYGVGMLNQSVLVLDDAQKVCPPQVVGQIYLGGVGLARGYWNRPDLTAAKFVANSLPAVPGPRLYATGDLGRLMLDGNVEFLGRIDGQVKIRGYRVELGEIEATLLRYPSIREAAVVACDDSGESHKSLVAYVVLADSPSESLQSLREFLRKSLPEFMLPARFVPITALPLTANGKVDRHALIARDLRLFGPRSEYQPPIDDAQRTLVNIWEDGFNRRPIGIDDDYFDLGGDSLLAVSLFVRIEQELGQSLAFDTLIETPTIRLLSGAICKANRKSRSPLVTIQKGTSLPPLFCIPGISGSVLELHDLGTHLGPNQPMYGLRPFGVEGRELPHASIVDMATCYLNAIRRVQAHGPYYFAGYSLGGIVAFEMARQLKAAGESIKLLAILDSLLPPRRRGRTEVVAAQLKNLWRQNWLGRYRYFAERVRRLLTHRIGKGALTNGDDWLLERNLTPERLNVAQIHLRAWRSYKVVPYDGRLTLFLAAEQEPTDLYGAAWSPSLEWSRATSATLEVHVIPGNHNSILIPPNVTVLAARLIECLNRHQCEK